MIEMKSIIGRCLSVFVYEYCVYLCQLDMIINFVKISREPQV